MAGLIEFSEYEESERGSGRAFINPEEIAAVREWRYHSFRPAISEIVLQSGEKIRVWEPIEVAMSRIAKAQK